MAAIPFALEDAVLGDAMSFIVVDRDGVQYEVKTAKGAADYLVHAWSNTLELLGESELVPYTPEVIIHSGEGRALAITDDLREENEVVDELLADDDRPLVKPSQVSGELYLYVVVSDTEAGRVAMIKKKNPTKRARAGKAHFLAADELREMDADPWELHPIFDLVVGEDGGYALNTFFFEQLFADADRLRAKIGPWVSDIATHLPMADESRDLLIAACDESPRLRRRLRAIAHRGHISRVSVRDIRRHVREMGLDTADFVRNGQLVVHEDSLGELLRMLNEDLTRGGLTRDPFRIESKEPM